MEPQDGVENDIIEVGDSSGAQFSRFSRFSELPAEIRYDIWELVCYQERNIPIDVKYYAVPGREWFARYFMWRYFSFCPPPAILHCTQESRTEGLKKYDLSFGQTLDFPEGQVDDDADVENGLPAVTVETPATIYINWKVDRPVFISPDHFFHAGENNRKMPDDFLDICRANNLQRLAFNIDIDCTYFAYSCAGFPEFLLFSAPSDLLWINLKHSQHQYQQLIEFVYGSYLDANPDPEIRENLPEEYDELQQYRLNLTDLHFKRNRERPLISMFSQREKAEYWIQERMRFKESVQLGWIG